MGILTEIHLKMLWIILMNMMIELMTKKQILITITSHCLPKLVCQLHSLENRDSLSDSERNLISLVGSASISGSPSKYSFAAHMGQLMRGVEGQGCHNFYPECPFSNQDVMQIAKRINFK